MDRILEKFGIYDLIAVLVPGIGMYTLSILVLPIISFDINVQVDGMLPFMVVSYFVGLVFQELGSLLQQKLTHKNSRLLKIALGTSLDSHVCLSETERNAIYSYVAKELHKNADEISDSVVYNYCKFYILENEDTSRIDKDQSLSAMSRSFALYFTCLSVIMFADVIVALSLVKTILMVMTIAFAVLFYYRCIRFATLRYVYIFHTFYCKKILKNSSLQ